MHHTEEHFLLVLLILKTTCYHSKRTSLRKQILQNPVVLSFLPEPATSPPPLKPHVRAADLTNGRLSLAGQGTSKSCKSHPCLPRPPIRTDSVLPVNPCEPQSQPQGSTRLIAQPPLLCPPTAVLVIVF